ncbi:MAG: DUF4394 domain-containing protein [Bryobacteraceae bacterium]
MLIRAKRCKMARSAMRPVILTQVVRRAVVGMAYTNNFVGAQTSTLFGVEGDGNLVRIEPNSGTLHTIGRLANGPVGITSYAAGVDISGQTGIAYFPGFAGGQPTLFTVDLQTGLATQVGTFPFGLPVITGLAVSVETPIPELSTLVPVCSSQIPPRHLPSGSRLLELSEGRAEHSQRTHRAHQRTPYKRTRSNTRDTSGLGAISYAGFRLIQEPHIQRPDFQGAYCTYRIERKPPCVCRRLHKSPSATYPAHYNLGSYGQQPPVTVRLDHFQSPL